MECLQILFPDFRRISPSAGEFLFIGFCSIYIDKHTIIWYAENMNNTIDHQ